MIRIWPNKSTEVQGNIRLKSDNKKSNVFAPDENPIKIDLIKTTLSSSTNTTTAVSNSIPASASYSTVKSISSSNASIKSQDLVMTTGATVQPTTSSSSSRSSRYMKGGSLDSRYSTSIASSQR